MDTFEILPDENMYYRWRSKAQREGFLYKLCLAYYASSQDSLYSISVDGDRRVIPVFVDGDWFQRVGADAPISGYASEEFSKFDIETIKKLAKSVAYEKGKTEGSITDHIWNDPTYGVIGARTDSLKFNLQLTDYFTVRSLSGQLTEEAFESAYELELPASSSRHRIDNALHDMDLSFRDQYYRDFDSMAQFNVPRLCARSTIVVLNTGEGYAIPFEQRSSSVSESPFWWNPIPGSVFQPLTEDESRPSMKRDTVHAVANKLTPDQDSKQVISYLKDALSGGDATLEYTTTGIDCINGYVQFYNMLFMKESEFYDQFITEDQNSWHSKDTSLIHIGNEDRMNELLDPTVLNPYNVLGLSEAVMRLEEYHGVEVPLDLARWF